MQIGIGIGPGFGGPGVPGVPPAPIGRVVFVGASIIEQTFGRNLATPHAARTAAFRAAGLAVDVYGYGWSGATVASIRPRVVEALAAHPEGTLFVIHIGGNNVTATRPFASASASQKTAIASDYAALIADIGARKGDVILCPTTFRTYQDAADIAALPAPRDAVFADEALGSRPYNDAIFIPAIAAWRPETINTDGNPVVDLYNATRNVYESYVSGDGVHPANPAGRDILAQVMIDRLGWAIGAAPVPAPILPRSVALAAPVNTAPPVISGVAQEGQVLTGTTGAWTGTPAPGFTRQWRRGGVDIPGATGATYTLVAVDVGSMITLRVTATNSEGSASATSAATATVTAVPSVPARTLIVNFGNAPAGFLGTNIVAADVRSALNPTRPPVALTYDDGTASPYTLLVAHPASAISNNTYNNNVGGGRATGVAAYDGTLFNTAIYGSSIFADMVSGPFTLTLGGLTPGGAYALTFGASRGGTSAVRITEITDGSVTISYNATQDPPPAPVTGSFVADAAGEITLTVSNPAGGAINTWAYLGGMQVAAG